MRGRRDCRTRLKRQLPPPLLFFREVDQHRRDSSPSFFFRSETEADASSGLFRKCIFFSLSFLNSKQMEVVLLLNAFPLLPRRLRESRTDDGLRCVAFPSRRAGVENTQRLSFSVPRSRCALGGKEFFSSLFNDRRLPTQRLAFFSWSAW